MCKLHALPPVRAALRGKLGHEKAELRSARSRELIKFARGTRGAAVTDISGKEGEGVLVSSASRSKRLALSEGDL